MAQRVVLGAKGGAGKVLQERFWCRSVPKILKDLHAAKLSGKAKAYIIGRC